VLAALLISAALAPLLALLGLHAPLWLIVVAAVFAGAETTLYNTLLSSALQSNLPSDTLGRATAITGIGSSLLVPVGMGLAGILANAIGVSTVLIAGAGLVIAATAICASMPSTHAHLHLSKH
jgi:hypothetical protein